MPRCSTACPMATCSPWSLARSRRSSSSSGPPIWSAARRPSSASASPCRSVPPGGEDDAIELYRVGTVPEFGFTPRDHLDLGELLGAIDVVRAAKVSGARFGYLTGPGAMLEFALVRFAIDRLASAGFVPMIPPVLVRRDAMYGTGFLPTDEQQIFRIPEDDLYLVGTSEVPLVSYHADEILDPGSLPRRYVGFSTCFRREAGSYGKDTRGIFRVHQFDKDEMVSC